MSSTQTGISVPQYSWQRQSQQSLLQQTTAAVRVLNRISMVDRVFAVARDPDTMRFVVEVRDRGTGMVIDQLPPESVMKIAAQISPAATTAQTEPGT